jgi:hypothetical protein
MKRVERIEAYKRNVQRHDYNIAVAQSLVDTLKAMKKGRVQGATMHPELLRSNLYRALWALRCERKFRRKDQAELEDMIGLEAWARKRVMLKRKYKQDFDSVVHWIPGNWPPGINTFAACGYPSITWEDAEPGEGQKTPLCAACQELHGGPF